MTESDRDRIRVGVSSCLLGRKVRFDAGHKHDRYLTDELGRWLELVPVCPEAEVGMGIPRESVHLTGDAAAPRMVGSRSGEDWTERMRRWSRSRVKELGGEDLCGFVFKKDSPSCGAWRVKVRNPGGIPERNGRGLFADAFALANPLLPLEEEGRLHDAKLRENFIERIFAYHRATRLFLGKWTRGDAVAFHSREKYLLMAHSPQHYRELGRLVAAVKDHTPAAFRELYLAGFMAALAVHATPSRHGNALLHIVGYLRGHVADEERRRVAEVIADHRTGLVPLIVPMTLVKHYIELHDIAYIRDQSYLNPHPRELLLRNHV